MELIGARAAVQRTFQIEMAAVDVAVQKDLPNTLSLVTRGMKALLLAEPMRADAADWLFRCRVCEDGSLVLNQVMRTIRFDFPVTRLKFRAQLRLEAAARFFKLSFSARHVSQDCVQALWTQHQQSEHQHEQDFRAEPHASPLVQALIVGNDCGWVGRFIFLSLHS
jgi:hypothetical protein